ncbi:MAG: ImmA/IrrE family metallo-endopeptidase [Candidatus Marinimicrobia bacterium]|nr:ImmA/IrrE family metallo-endopeptidase [Candidatus Neomarinimicrobiota bacterium]
MERAQNINPQRIEWSCEEFGITPKLLSIQLKISWGNFEKTMRGEDGITIKQLRKVADYFNRGLLFYFEESPVNEETIYTPQFRTLTGQKPLLSPDIKILIERVEKQREIYIELLDDLGEGDNYDWEKFKLPSHTQQNIKKSAALVRRWLELEERETFDSYRLKVENKGVFVFVTNGYKGKWQIAKDDNMRGFSLYYPTFPIIAIKKQDSLRPQVFTLMHELGHLLLHRNGFIDDENDLYNYQGVEKAANEFAGNILVPDEFLKIINLIEFPYGDVQEYDENLKDFVNQWSVSTEVILIRMLKEEMIQQAHYDGYKSWRKSIIPRTTSGGSRKYRHREPIKMFGANFVSTVLNAYHEKRITLAKASNYLDNLKIADIHQLEKMNGFI